MARIALVGGDLHPRVERGPHVDRLGRLVDQGVELGQRPVGEVAHAIVVGGLLDPDCGGVDLGRGVGADEAIVDHRLQHHARSRARGLDVGGRRIIGRRLDEAGDDRRLAEAQMIGAMTEEAPRGGIDPVGAAAEIDAVEIELEDLVLGELPLERERQDRFLDLAAEAAVVGQEDVARQLLGDRRAALAGDRS